MLGWESTVELETDVLRKEYEEYPAQPRGLKTFQIINVCLKGVKT